MKKFSGWLILLLMIGAVIIMFNRISDSYDIHTSEFEELSFIHDGNQMSGTLFKPEEVETFPLVIFIHGDGPQDRRSKSEYNMLINGFIDKGIACYSYDKAGVGESEGDWLTQSMSDRGDEVLSSISMLRKRSDINEIGLLGLSQGGWVLSEIAMKSQDYDFMILMSGAIDWMEQSLYMDEVTLASGDLSEEEKNEFRNYMKEIYDFLLENDYEGYIKFIEENSPDSIPMSIERFSFVHINMESNAKEGIPYIDVPFLGLFGAKDMNVDASNSYNVYKDIFNKMNKSDSELILYENGTHSLLKSKYETNALTPKIIVEMFLIGNRIYVDGVLDKLGDWVNETINTIE